MKSVFYACYSVIRGLTTDYLFGFKHHITLNRFEIREWLYDYYIEVATRHF